MIVLRWILVVPVSLTCGILLTMAARVISRGITFLKVITGFVSGFICISVAGWLAPVHETATMIVLAIVYGFYWASEASKVAAVTAVLTGQRIDWLFVSCGVGGLVAAFS